MRGVAGATDRVVVVGAGLGGLSAALHLAGSGREVTVLERGLVPGGRAGLLHEDGYRFDTGPAVLTMPGILSDCFAAAGESLEDWLRMTPVDPAYRAFFPDGSRLDVLTDAEAMASEVTRVAGVAEARRYRAFTEHVSSLHRIEMRSFIDRNVDSPFGLLVPDLARLAGLGAFGRLAPLIDRYFHDPRTRRVFSFQAMYAGLSPYRALALYAVISYMDCVAGVWFPEGGMHAIPRAMAGAAERRGISVRYGVTVARVERRGRRAVAVHTEDGERLPCDVVVLNPDLPVARRDLLGAPLRRPLRYSPSCFLLLAGSTAAYSQTAHHNIHFGRSWRQVFRELIDDGRLMSDPSFFVSNPTRTDPSLAPAGRHSYYVLFPAPNTGRDAEHGRDWRELGPRYRQEVMARLERAGYVGFADAAEVEHVTTPRDWERAGMAGGTPFATAHTLSQSGPFRPRNLWGDNVVFTGSGTHPGVGIPMVLLSGRLAAQRITGRPAERP